MQLAKTRRKINKIVFEFKKKSNEDLKIQDKIHVVDKEITDHTHILEQIT